MKIIISMILMLSTFAVIAGNPILCSEIVNDPDGHGYEQLAGPQEIIEELLAENIPNGFHACVERDLLLDQIDLDEWDNQTAGEAQRLEFLTVFGGDGCISPSGFARHIAKRTFPIAGSPTIAAMVDVARIYISRAAQLGVTGKIRTADVEGCE